jgi:hypothetical protein
MDSTKTWLEGLVGLGGVPMKVLEVSKSPWINGFWSDDRGEHLFLQTPPKTTNLPPPWLPSTRGSAHLQYQEGPRNKDKGAVLPLGSAGVGMSCAAVGTTVCLAPPLHWSPPSPCCRLSLLGRHYHYYLKYLFIIPTVISWQMWCLMQYIIFSWSIVSLCLVWSSNLFIKMVK